MNIEYIIYQFYVNLNVSSILLFENYVPLLKTRRKTAFLKGIQVDVCWNCKKNVRWWVRKVMSNDASYHVRSIGSLFCWTVVYFPKKMESVVQNVFNCQFHFSKVLKERILFYLLDAQSCPPCMPLSDDVTCHCLEMNRLAPGKKP